jgi:hypothetical protein
MYQKNAAFFADWRDRKGRRHRKSFPTAALALAHQEAQQANTHPQKAKALRSPRSLRRNSHARASNKPTKPPSRKHSSRPQAASTHRGSARSTSPRRKEKLAA